MILLCLLLCYLPYIHYIPRWLPILRVSMKFCHCSLLCSLIFLLPMLFYLYPMENKKSTISYSLPYFATAFVYIILRFASVGIPHSNAGVKYINNQLRMDPYYLATPIQKFATEWYALGKYIFQ